MEPVTIVLAIAKFLGVDGAKKLSFGAIKWAFRLAVLAVVVVAVWLLYMSDLLWWVAGAVIVPWLLWKVFQWSRRPKDVGGPVERTIDGKPVPDKLAVAALGVPPQSAGIDDMLRSLPDFGKALLKLDAREFEYLPETPEEDITEPESPLEEPAPRRSWAFPDVRRPALAAGVAALVLLALVGISQVFGLVDFSYVSPELMVEAVLAVVMMLALAFAAFLWRRGTQPGPEPVKKSADKSRIWLTTFLRWVTVARAEVRSEASGLLKELRGTRKPVKKATATPDTVPLLRVARVNARIWLTTLPRWAKAAGAAALLLTVMGGAGVISNARRSAEEQRSQKEHDAFREWRDAQTRRAEETVKNSRSTPEPPPVDPPKQVPVDGVSDLVALLRGDEELKQDPETGKKWTTRDNGPEPIKDYDGAERYCKSVDAGGLKGWRLPSLDELSNMWNRLGGLKGYFRLNQANEIFWSSTLSDDGIHHNAFVVGKVPAGADIYSLTHALCVHD